MLLRHLLVVASVVSLVGCKSAVARAIDERRAEVSANLARVEALGATLASIPPASKASIAATSPVVFVIDHKEDLPTATFVHAEDLATLADPDRVLDRVYGTALLRECASLLTTGKHVSKSNPNVFANVVSNYLDKCKSIKTVFVIRTQKREPRSFTGDVVAFDLASGKHVGGFPLVVSSDGRTDKVTNVSTTTSTRRTASGRRRTTITKTSSDSYVNSDADQLRSDIATALDDAIESAIPDAKFID